MKKKIIKVSVLTLLITFGVYFITWSAMTLCFPLKTAEIYSSMGLNKTACRLYEVSYKRKPSVNKLKKVVVYSEITKNNKKVVKYGNLLLEDDDFDVTYENEFYGDFVLWYVKAYYALGKDDAVDKTIEMVIEERNVDEADGEVFFIPENNGIRVLSVKCYLKNDLASLKSLKERLNNELNHVMADNQEETVFSSTVEKEIEIINRFITELENRNS